MGLAVSRPYVLEPVPASALHTCRTVLANARWPGALFGRPPGWVQRSLARGGGSTTGRSADASSAPPPLSLACITAMRLPGRGCCFSAKGLRSVILGMLGRLSEQPERPAERSIVHAAVWRLACLP